MKKIIAAFIIAFSFIQVHAQNVVLPKDVPAAVMQKMNKMFPSATSAAWKQDMPGFVSVDFTMDKKKMSATFTGDGGWVSTSTYISKEELPKGATDYLNSKFNGGKIKTCDISETVKEKTYECHIKYNGHVHEVIFDMDGNYKSSSLLIEM